MTIFAQISAILFLATVVSIILKLLKQPLIVGYILTGIIVGPNILNILPPAENLEFFSKLGITILLFIVGLSLNPNVIKEVGKVSALTAIGQVFITTAIGFVICLFLGFSTISSAYISIALTFSSTIIILKLLTDKGDITSLYGKITIGFLLIQDLLAIFSLIILTSLSKSGQDGIFTIVAALAAKGILVSALLYITSKYIFPRLLKYVASNSEMLFLFSLAWGTILASLFDILGFSVEIGALIAGVALSATPFAAEISSRMKPLRDFFILLFFITLGSQIALGSLGTIIVPALILSTFVLIGNPIIMIVIMNLLGYKRKTSFLIAVTIAQISEFSLILISLGVQLGNIPHDVLSLVTLVGLITITGSTYLILSAEKLFKPLEPFIKLLEFRRVPNEKMFLSEKTPEIILFGYDRSGTDFVKAIQKLDKSFVIVDFNPQSIQRLKDQKLPYAFGDADDVELLEEIGLPNAKLIVSTIPTFETNKLLVQRMRSLNPKSISIVLSHNVHETLELYRMGASYVIMPLYLGAQYAMNIISKHGLDSKVFVERKQRHMQHLSNQILW